jgi:cytochrome c
MKKITDKEAFDVDKYCKKITRSPRKRSPRKRKKNFSETDTQQKFHWWNEIHRRHEKN